MAKHCTYVKKNGERCRAYARVDSLFCFWHDPATRKERGLARKKGGYHRKKPRNADQPAPEIHTIADLLAVLTEAVRDAWAAEPSMARARALGYLAASGVRLVEVGELERRVEALEAKAKELTQDDRLGVSGHASTKRAT